MRFTVDISKEKGFFSRLRRRANDFRDWFGMTRFILFFMSLAQSLLLISIFQTIISDMFMIVPIFFAYLCIIFMFRMEYGEFNLNLDLLRKEQKKLILNSIKKEKDRKKRARERAKRKDKQEEDK